MVVPCRARAEFGSTASVLVGARDHDIRITMEYIYLWPSFKVLTARSFALPVRWVCWKAEGGAGAGIRSMELAMGLTLLGATRSRGLTGKLDLGTSAKHG